VERIALGASSERPESVRKLLVARLIGAVVGLFGLALTAVLGLIRIVIGVGIVVVLHKPHDRDSQPRNPPTLDPTPPRVQFAFQPAAQRLSSTSRDTATPISRPIYMLYRNSNLNPVIDARSR
jgi:hypothetical protein